MSRRQFQRGFSLVELLTVVLLMGILAALALPRFDPGIHEQLQAVANIVCSDLAYARSLAVTNNSRYRVRFNLANNHYVLGHSGASAALNQLPETASRSPSDPIDQQIVELADVPCLGGHNLRLAAVTGDDDVALASLELEFGSLGETTRSQETRIWLAGGTAAQTRYVAIHVNPVTGMATVGEFTSSGPTAGGSINPASP